MMNKYIVIFSFNIIDQFSNYDLSLLKQTLHSCPFSPPYYFTVFVKRGWGNCQFDWLDRRLPNFLRFTLLSAVLEIWRGWKIALNSRTAQNALVLLSCTYKLLKSNLTERLPTQLVTKRGYSKTRQEAPRDAKRIKTASN